ncbi:hypothetical protein EIP91_000289 [Steccherinum ochraceum]|uniref:Uncharacterized protein n=1 Tax=Steccherinum ochraceum TaxID=92696 RepID=A0A4R0RPQ0_9APHY|nr:hypothetical protein EIP91_000289 [Steccherinum ochraceum]
MRLSVAHSCSALVLPFSKPALSRYEALSQPTTSSPLPFLPPIPTSQWPPSFVTFATPPP